LNAERSEGQRIQVKIIRGSSDARIEVSDDGELQLQWQTGENLPDQTRIGLEVTNVDTDELLELRTIIFVKSGALPEQTVPAQEMLTDKALGATIDGAEEISTLPLKVNIDPPASQIVSVGRGISARFRGTVSDGSEPIFSIDRIPPNARFERHVDGGFVFYWNTTNRNQGEHVFRITARHGQDDKVFDEVLWSVVIGNPSLGRTEPKPGRS